MSRLAPALPLLVAALLSGCDRAAPAEGAPAKGHIFSDIQSGIALDLPANWAGRYRMTDTVTRKEPGIERELTLRFIKADSTVEPQPLLVIHVVSAAAWNALEPATASTRYGTVMARDAARTVAVRAAGGNPLAPGTADALAYDSLMVVLIQRPMRAQLRPEPAKR